jgi:hypothetical protein
MDTTLDSWVMKEGFHIVMIIQNIIVGIVVHEESSIGASPASSGAARPSDIGDSGKSTVM